VRGGEEQEEQDDDEVQEDEEEDSLVSSTLIISERLLVHLAVLGGRDTSQGSLPSAVSGMRLVKFLTSLTV
jgi:hypothetical protein